MEKFPNVQFYDYTKFPRRDRTIPVNYHLTFSLSGEPDSYEKAKAWFADGFNVAVVWHLDENGRLPSDFLGRRVIDGDENDVRFRDPQGVIVGLKAKGAAVKADSKFVFGVYVKKPKPVARDEAAFAEARRWTDA